MRVAALIALAFTLGRPATAIPLSGSLEPRVSCCIEKVCVLYTSTMCPTVVPAGALEARAEDSVILERRAKCCAYKCTKYSTVCPV
jgi:hypothetical protein